MSMALALADVKVKNKIDKFKHLTLKWEMQSSRSSIKSTRP
jgi:hypothetical protein